MPAACRFCLHVIEQLGVRSVQGVLRIGREPLRHETCVMEQAMSTRSSERRRYRIIAASLRPEDVSAADRIVDVLRDEGWPHANRSLVIREALSGLSDALKERSPEEIFRHFIERRGRRIPSTMKPNSVA
jgi:hypothetical protein